jgi:hypothetical protein
MNRPHKPNYMYQVKPLQPRLIFVIKAEATHVEKNSGRFSLRPSQQDIILGQRGLPEGNTQTYLASLLKTKNVF